LARRSSLFSRSNSLTRCFSAVVTPSRTPLSTSWRFTQVNSVWGTQPIFDAMDSTAAHSDGYSPRCSCTRRTVRSRTSRENLFDLFMAPFSQELEPPQNPGRFTLLYEEYASGLDSNPMSDREFRRRYDRYKRSLGLVMRQARRPGEELFVDYSGKRPSITDSETGARTPVELWVGVVGSSRKTFAYCTVSQQLPEWIDAHVRAFEFFSVLPQHLV